MSYTSSKSTHSSLLLLLNQIKKILKSTGPYSNKTTAKRLESLGRSGDTILAHINPEEARILKAMGGRGTINPRTGLREYGKTGFNKWLRDTYGLSEDQLKSYKKDWKKSGMKGSVYKEKKSDYMMHKSNYDKAKKAYDENQAKENDEQLNSMLGTRRGMFEEASEDIKNRMSELDPRLKQDENITVPTGRKKAEELEHNQISVPMTEMKQMSPEELRELRYRNNANAGLTRNEIFYHENCGHKHTYNSIDKCLTNHKNHNHLIFPEDKSYPAGYRILRSLDEKNNLPIAYSKLTKEGREDSTDNKDKNYSYAQDKKYYENYKNCEMKGDKSIFNSHPEYDEARNLYKQGKNQNSMDRNNYRDKIYNTAINGTLNKTWNAMNEIKNSNLKAEDRKKMIHDNVIKNVSKLENLNNMYSNNKTIPLLYDEEHFLSPPQKPSNYEEDMLNKSNPYIENLYNKESTIHNNLEARKNKKRLIMKDNPGSDLQQTSKRSSSQFATSSKPAQGGGQFNRNLNETLNVQVSKYGKKK